MNIVKAIYYRAKSHECYKRYTYWSRKAKSSLDTNNTEVSFEQLRHALYWLEQQLVNSQKMDKELES